MTRRWARTAAAVAIVLVIAAVVFAPAIYTAVFINLRN